VTNKIPNTPFATRLSGSARETQLRLRSIFQWKKKRPPVWLFAIIALVVLGCFGLISCQPEEPEQPQTPVEENADGDKHSDFFDGYQSDFNGYQYTGQTSFSFDDRGLTLWDVPENLVEELLFSNYYFAAAFEFDGLMAIQGDESLKIGAQNEEKNARDGIYFTDVTIHTLDVLSEEDFAPGGSYFADENQVRLFVDELSELVQEHGLKQYAVVYADLSWQWSEKALELGPQLGDGRYERLYLAGKVSEDANWLLYECFWGEYTLGRTYSAQDAMNTLVMSELFAASNISDLTAILGDEANATSQLLLPPAEEGQSFTAAYFTERGSYELVIAVWDAESNSIVGTPFRAANSGGTPKVEKHEWQGEQRLLYTANGADQGITGGQAGEIALRDGEMIWLWPVEGDIRDISHDPSGQPYQNYLEYWDDHFALMIPGGFEIFNENEEFGFYEGSPQQWEFRGEAISYYLDGRPLVDSDREQVRAWLEEFGRDGNNGMDRKNDSASWRILALDRSGMHKKCELMCVSEYDETAYLWAVLKIDHMRQEPLEVLDWEIGHASPEKISAEAASYNRMATARDRLILEYMQTRYPDDQVYFVESLKEEVEHGQTAIKTISLMGQSRLYDETIGAVYLVTVQRRVGYMNGGVQGYFDHILVLTRDNESKHNGILGEAVETGGKTVEEIVESMRVQLTPEGKPLLMDYFQNVHQHDRAYFLGEEPGVPQEDDLRIDSVRFLGSEVTHETTGEAYLVRASIYNERLESADGQPIIKWWPVDQEYYFVLGRAMDGELEEVRGQRYYIGDSIEHMILEESYGVSDWDVALRHDGNPYPHPLALGQWNANVLRFVEGEPTVEILEGWEPVYQDGDYWDRWSVDGLSVLRYYNSVEGTYRNNTIDLTRDDFETLRGIRVGSSRDEVMAAYPEAVENNYWGRYPDDLPLCWYANPEADLGPDVLGPAILFFFENDKVSKIILNDMFN